MKFTIYFDMDGTLNEFYKVNNWLPKLRAYDPSPYAEAGVMHNMSLLARYLNKVQKMGYQIGIISWLAKDSTDEYDKQVTMVKQNWLKYHLNSVHFDIVHIVPYGIPKESFINTEQDILFDDNESIRNNWTGKAYKPEEIIQVLKDLVNGE